MILDKIDNIFMLNVCFLSKFPKVALNFSRNTSKSLSKGDDAPTKVQTKQHGFNSKKFPKKLLCVYQIRKLLRNIFDYELTMS